MTTFNFIKEPALRRGVTKALVDVTEWLAIIVLHSVVVCNMLDVLNGLTDQFLPIDTIFLIGISAILLFVKVTIERKAVSILTSGMGFIVQAVLLSLIFV